MTTVLYTHDAFGAHEVPAGHPEHGGRYRAVEAALAGEAFADLVRRAAPLAPAEAVGRVHPQAHHAALEAASPAGGLVRLDPDTVMGPHTLEAALRAAGAAVAAVDALFAGEADTAFVAARPPGHHAEPDRAMGFCYLNAAAIAALHARAVHGARRVAVVDFDVHHGNGTEAAFWHDEDAFFGSSHEHPQYPGTGRASDCGAHDTIVNAPLPTGTDGEGFRRAWGERILPRLHDFAPDIVVVSAGFDAHRADPLGGLLLTEADFVWVTNEILGVARATCAGRVVSLLEGGYDLGALGRSVAAHVGVLMGAPMSGHKARMTAG